MMMMIAPAALAALLSTVAPGGDPLEPRVYHSAARVSLRPPAGFALELLPPPSPGDGDDGIDPIASLDERGAETPSRLSIYLITDSYKSLDDFVKYVARENEKILEGAKVAATEDCAVGAFAGRLLTYGPLPQSPGWLASSYAFGDAAGWFSVDVLVEEKRPNAHRDAIRAAVQSIRRHFRSDLDRALGERVLVPALGLSVRAPAGWRATGAEADPSALATFAGDAGARITLARDAAAAATLAEAARAAAGEGAPSRSARLHLPCGEALLLDFPPGAGDGEPVRLAAVVAIPGLPLRVETIAPRAAAETRRAEILDLLVDLSAKDPAALRTTAAAAAERYAQAAKRGVPSTAAQSLAELAANGSKEAALPVLLGALAEKSEVVRAAAAEALGAYHLRDPKSAAPPLVRLADGGSKANGALAVAAACRTLGVLGSPDATKALVRRLADPDDTVARAAIEALGGAGGDSADAEAALERLWEKLETAAKISSNAVGKRRLAALGPPIAEALLRLTGERFASAAEAKRARADRRD